MKKFLNVLSFELTNYFKNKGYMITTILISAILIIGLSLPSLFDLSGLIPGLSKNNATVEENQGGDSGVIDSDSDEENVNYVIFDKSGLIADDNFELIKSYFPNANFEKVTSEEDAEKLVKDGSAKAGFVVESAVKYYYLVENSNFADMSQMTFHSALAAINRKEYAEKEGIDYLELETIVNLPITSETTVLGKDGAGNFGYVYILVFVIYMMTILYGQLVAVSVTSEKSSRAIEVLVTSTSSTSLILGKVIAATLASVIQVGVMLSAGVVTYAINRDAWNGMLDGVLKMPSDILLAFAFFGGVGYLFYCFIFGALGALVSKTEDISSSIGSITMIFVIVFFISMFGMMGNADSLIVKIASFVPFSSSMTMLIRIAMGTVSTIEIIISFVILVLSTITVAWGAIKIYRLATLRYGNPIKLKNALKWLKKK
ncbi:ABC transporter permease [Clostridium sp. NSJ-49]|uniref:ABC transporter permease n=1 Tax=Clostridium sp. NSJ-49 TaxID=2763034 RepID=UPI00164BF877|nr:ABC transporter permease [Clostridium sp. NSJ-49]MBC5627056.1 ABC transporter permease [Clostridium sp. NSJ-49]MDU6340164.1 ABC transporter permease [Clostridium sp.]